MAAIFILCMISSLKPYVGLSCKLWKTLAGVTFYVIAWMLQTCGMALSLIYKVSFSLCKIIQISLCQNKAVQAVPNSPLRKNI